MEKPEKEWFAFSPEQFTENKKMAARAGPGIRQGGEKVALLFRDSKNALYAATHCAENPRELFALRQKLPDLVMLGEGCFAGEKGLYELMDLSSETALQNTRNMVKFITTHMPTSRSGASADAPGETFHFLVDRNGILQKSLRC